MEKKGTKISQCLEQHNTGNSGRRRDSQATQTPTRHRSARRVRRRRRTRRRRRGGPARDGGSARGLCRDGGWRGGEGRGGRAGDLRRDGRGEGAGHARQSEFGGKGEGGDERVRGVFAGYGLVADEVEGAVGSDRGVRRERDRAGDGNVYAGIDALEESLLLSVADVDGDPGKAHVIQSGLGAVGGFLPCDGLGGTGCPRGGSHGGCGEEGSEGARGESEEYGCELEHHGVEVR